jgi:hypothetical protein
MLCYAYQVDDRGRTLVWLPDGSKPSAIKKKNTVHRVFQLIGLLIRTRAIE